MYSKQEASRLKQEFWTVFGQYMLPQPSADGEKVNWVNYKTRLQHVAFRMDADTRKTVIGIVISHPDASMRELYFKQFIQLKTLLTNEIQEEWQWEPLTIDEYGKTLSRIYKEMDNVNIFDKATWPNIISFLKPRIVALDAFWSGAQYTFEHLK